MDPPCIDVDALQSLLNILPYSRKDKQASISHGLTVRSEWRSCRRRPIVVRQLKSRAGGSLVVFRHTSDITLTLLFHGSELKRIHNLLITQSTQYYTYTMTIYNSVLFLGATGYIGGTVLQTILASATPPSTITAIVRNEKKAEALNSLSTPSGTTLKAVIGDLSKADQLIELAKEHDIVINCANADSEEGIKALIEGMKQRRDKTGHRPLLIQTSGTGVLVDDAQGRYPSDRVSSPLTQIIQRLIGRSTPT